jgi:chaperonin GroEL
MIKQVTFSKDARAKLMQGVNTVADAVRGTLGPKGKAVLIDKGVPVFTRDGVTVAQSIEQLEDKIENQGAQLVKGVAQKTNEEAGDGTTTAAILIQELLKEGTKGVEMGIDPIKMSQAMEDGSKVILETLQNYAKPVKTMQEMKDVATISSRDPEIGAVIGKIYDKIGVDGVITTEESKTIGLDYELVEGLELDKGFAAPHFMTDVGRERAEIENPYILVTSQSISRNADIADIMSAAHVTDSKALVILAEDVTGEAMATLIVNKLKGVMKTLVLRAPGFGDSKKAYMEDVAALTGATIISEETGGMISEATLDQCGKATRVIAYKDKAYIVGGQGSKKVISARIKMLKKQIGEETATYKKDELEKRYARLKGGVAIIKVGAMTEEASREKQYRIEDAVNATKSALQEGIVIGGGLALYKASQGLDKLIEGAQDTNYRYGLQALQTAIQAPARQVLLNAGQKADVILDAINALDVKYPKQGYDAGIGRFVDMIKEGIIDPLKVERVALQQSVSIAGLYIITNAVVCDKPEEKKESKPLT